MATVAEATAAQMYAQIEGLLHRAAERAAAQARLAIQSPPKTGRIYMRRGRPHQASAPGEAPATDTGFLVNSIQTRQSGYLSWDVLASAVYAVYLEVGTMRMAPRPFLLPAVLAQGEWIREQLRGVFNG